MGGRTVIVREVRPKDVARLMEFLRGDFPVEEAMLGTRPEGVDKIVRRVYRWDTRLLLGLMRLLGRPVFYFFVIEENGRLVATTQLSFAERAGYISMVVVDRDHRRRGLAQQLLERARQATRRRGLPYVALDVLATNTPARTLYERVGYRSLRPSALFVHEQPSTFLPAPVPPPGLRPFAARDAAPLVEVARRARPAEVERVLPASAREIMGSPWVERILASESAAWVVDDGSGAKAWVSATVTPATEAAHLANSIVDVSAGPDVVEQLVRTAGAWCAARGAPRIVTQVPAENARGRAAIQALGFREVVPVWTMYRPVD